MNDILAVVLNDGETYTNIEGCVVLKIPSDVPDEEADMFVRDNASEGLSLASLKLLFLDIMATDTEPEALKMITYVKEEEEEYHDAWQRSTKP